MTPRQRVFNELVQTETNFVNVLKSILYVFKRPLDDDQEQVCFKPFSIKNMNNLGVMIEIDTYLF